MRKMLAMVLAVIMITSLSACSSKSTNEDSAENRSTTINTTTCPASQYGNHNWKLATCQEPSRCKECDAYKNDELGTHYWDNATCQRPAKCMDCGTYADDKLGTHDFLSDGECLYCGIKYADYINSKK